MKKQFLIVGSVLVLDLMQQTVNMYIFIHDTTAALKYEQLASLEVLERKIPEKNIIIIFS